MNDKDIEMYVEELYKQLDGKIDRAEIEKIFRLWLSYNYSPETVKEKILQKYKPGRTVKIGEIRGEMKNVNTIGKIVAIKSNVRDGRSTFSGIIGDETGTIPFTTSRDMPFKKGDVIRITNAYTGYFNNVLRLYIPQGSGVEKLENYNMGRIQVTPSKFTIDKIDKNTRNIEVRIKVLHSEERETNGKKRISGVAGDMTGTIPFTAWNKMLEEGKSYVVKGAYAREFKGKIYLTIDENTEVEESGEDVGVNINLTTLQDAMRDGIHIGLFEGIFLDVSEDTGLVARCPVCRRILKGTECPEHGKVTPVNDLIGKATFDDGTLSGRVIFSRNDMEKILGKGFDDIVRMVVTYPGIPVVKEELEKRILLKPYRILAKVSLKEQNFINMTPVDIKEVGEKELSQLKEKLMEMM
ncbi:MAG: hypothetical protein ACP5GE_04360 [Thermoplasmata archaeon]